MKNIGTAYYRTIITVLLIIVVASIYSLINQNISINKNAQMIDKYYNDAIEAYEQGDYDRSKAQLTNAIASMKATEDEMDSLSHLQIHQSISELELLQKTITRNIISDDVMNVVFLRWLKALTYGEIQLAQKEILQNNVGKGILSLDRAKTHLFASSVYAKPAKHDQNMAMVGQIFSLINSLELNESYSEKLQSLSLNSKILLFDVH